MSATVTDIREARRDRWWREARDQHRRALEAAQERFRRLGQPVTAPGEHDDDSGPEAA